MGGKRWDGGKGGERKEEKDAAGWGIKLQLVSGSLAELENGKYSYYR